MGVKVVVFDLDGTLLDTLEDLADATNWALRKNGMPERALAEVRQFVGNGVRKLIERDVPEGEAIPPFEQTFDDFRESVPFQDIDLVMQHNNVVQRFELGEL